jgi:hypothetical protein
MVSSPPVLVWTSWSPTNPPSKGASARGVILCPGPSFQIRNVGRNAGGFKTVVGRYEVVFSKMHLGLDDGEFIVEMSESIVLATVALQFGSGVPIVEVGNSVSECVESGGWTDEEGVEPTGEGFGDIRG